MDKLTIVATVDIADEYISPLMDELGREKVHDPISRRALFSQEPPSFIEIVGTLVSWKVVFVASATAFFATLSKRLAEDVYDSKQRIAQSIFSPVKRLAGAIARVIRETPRHSFVRVTITAPNGIPSPSLSFFHESDDEIAFKISCFYAVSDMIIERLVEISKRHQGWVMPPAVSVSENGDVTVRCYAGINNEHIEFTISLLERL